MQKQSFVNFISKESTTQLLTFHLKYVAQIMTENTDKALETEKKHLWSFSYMVDSTENFH